MYPQMYPQRCGAEAAIRTLDCPVGTELASLLLPPTLPLRPPGRRSKGCDGQLRPPSFLAGPIPAPPLSVPQHYTLVISPRAHALPCPLASPLSRPCGTGVDRKSVV